MEWKNVDQLHSEVSDFEKSLNELKASTLSRSERITKENEVKDKAEKIKWQIDKLSWEEKVDARILAETERAQLLLKSCADTLNLKSFIDTKPAVVSLTDCSPTHTKENPMTMINGTNNEKKWFFWKIWEWLWNMWHDVTTWDKWQAQPWKNLLYATGIWLSWYGLYKWVKKLRNWAFWNKKQEWKEWDKSETEVKQENKDEEKKDEKKKDEERKDEEESFWSRWYWKALKWAWITTGAWWGIYKLGERLHLWWGKKESKKTDNTQTTDSLKSKSVENSENPSTNTDKDSQEWEKKSWFGKISDWMLKQLLKMEGSQDFVAHKAPQFWESFVTWPYGMVYKHIDENGNLLKKPISFKDGERVSQSWAENNARAHYDKCAKERKDALEKKWLRYNQNELDSLVSASWGTVASKKRLQNYVISHWDDKDAIFNFMSKFATTAAWNWKVMKGLVRRRKFEANWFKWVKEPFDSYKA